MELQGDLLNLKKNENYTFCLLKSNCIVLSQQGN